MNEIVLKRITCPQCGQSVRLMREGDYIYIAKHHLRKKQLAPSFRAHKPRLCGASITSHEA
jgi:ribosomal protein S27AE